jgi:hypothetical protein
MLDVGARGPGAAFAGRRTPWARRLALLAAALVPYCDHATVPEGPDRTVRTAFFVVADPDRLNASEELVRARLLAGDFLVEVVDDDRVAISASCSIVVLSKTSSSEKIGDRLKSTPCGVLFWEDNLQAIGMMATIDNDGADGTSWHSPHSQVVVDSRAPSALRAGLAGTVAFYTRTDEITWGPAADLPATATIVAIVEEPGHGGAAIYAYEAGQPLADGTPAAGRRLYFGLYDDTFRLLAPAGLALFDAALAWTAD